LREHTGDRCVLELGCGEGRDTAVLHAAGLGVVAIDRSLAALAEAREAVPGATFIESDLTRTAANRRGAGRSDRGEPEFALLRLADHAPARRAPPSLPHTQSAAPLSR